VCAIGVNNNIVGAVAMSHTLMPGVTHMMDSHNLSETCKLTNEQHVLT